MKKFFVLITIFMFAMLSNVLLVQIYERNNSGALVNVSFGYVLNINGHSGHNCTVQKYSPSHHLIYCFTCKKTAILQHNFENGVCTLCGQKGNNSSASASSSGASTPSQKPQEGTATVTLYSHGNTEIEATTATNDCTHPLDKRVFGPWNGWFADDNEHYVICDACGEHVDSPNTQIKNYQKARHHFVNGVCTVCLWGSKLNDDGILTIPLEESDCEHSSLLYGNYKNGWRADANEHYLECASCGKHLPSRVDPSIPLAHNYVYGACKYCNYPDPNYAQAPAVDLSTGFDTPTNNYNRQYATSNPLANASPNDKLNLYRIVEAECGGEPVEQRMGIAEVILNRVQNPAYPNTVTEVVYQKDVYNGQEYYQFEPLMYPDYWYNIQPSESTIQAVDTVLAGHRYWNDSNVIGFCTPAATTDYFWNNLDRVSGPDDNIVYYWRMR
ncbi:MAG: cell wall hydrolase [Clostridia bacterium]|nr:cell wall hydrolase [Clostridia bacterium]